MTSGQACAKLILLGEHAVVYNMPALALPLPQLQARVWIEASESPGVLLEAPDLPALWELPEAPQASPEPLIETLVRALAEYESAWPNCTLRIESHIPVARGLGSGTAVTAALWRALSAWLNHFPSQQQTLDFVTGIDQIYHGRPSGIDAQVIVRAAPLWFHRNKGVRALALSHPLHLLVADSGLSAATRTQVEKVAACLNAEPEKAQAWIREIGDLVQRAESCLAQNERETLGVLLNRNHELLIQLGVSHPRLNELCAAARQAGALGAKLSGAGGGGVMVALSEPEQRHSIKQALEQAGATQVFEIDIPPLEVSHE
ncbi:MAG: mevalonate kinase [Candidatus Sericytochromatia bacterium]